MSNDVSIFEHVVNWEPLDSPTFAAGAEAKTLLDKYPDAVNLTLGELFEFIPDAQIETWEKEAAVKASEDSLYKLADKKGRPYPATPGTPEFRSAAAADFYKKHGIKVDEKNIAVSSGGKGALGGIARTVAPNNKVIQAGPGWPTNNEIWWPGVRIQEVDTNGTGLMTPNMLRGALGAHPDAEMILINDPCNPTGARYSWEMREEIVQIVNEHRAKQIAKGEKPTFLLMDDPYGALNFDGTSLLRGPNEKALFESGGMAVVNSVSKVLGAPDLRVGYAVSKNQAMLKAIGASNTRFSATPTVESQNTAQLMLLNGEEFQKRASENTGRRAKLVANRVSKIPGLTMEEPKGAIYAWINCDGLLDKVASIQGEKVVLDSIQKIDLFLSEVAHVKVVTGSPFCAPNPANPARKNNEFYIRIVLTDDKKLNQAFNQIEAAILQLVNPWERVATASSTNIAR